jgi:hypothetical protein
MICLLVQPSDHAFLISNNISEALEDEAQKRVRIQFRAKRAHLDISDLALIQALLVLLIIT